MVVKNIIKVLLLFLCFLFTVKSFAQTRIALVIGNGDYQEQSLKNPTNDAIDISKTLRGLGFDVELKLNANQEDMEDAVQKFGKKLQGDTVGLFYYSGHGVQYGGGNYLIPIGAMSRVSAPEHLRYKAVDAGYILGVMKQAGNGLNIVILDACRNNPFRSFARDITKGLKRISGAEGTIVAYSTSPGKIALDGGGRNSPYTKQLIKLMKSPNLPVEIMFKQVRRRVKKETSGRQSPWYEASIDGDFYFSSTNNTPLIANNKDKIEPDFEQKNSSQRSYTLHISNKSYFEFNNKTREVKKVRFSHSGKYILGAGYRKIRIWDLKTKKLKATMSGHSGTVTSADFSPDDKYVVSGGYDGTVRLWKTSNGKLIKIIGKHSSYVESVQFSNNGKYIISSGIDNVAKLWDIKKKKLVRTFKGHQDWVYMAKFLHNDKKILTGSSDKSIVLWDIDSSEKIKTYNNFNGYSTESVTDIFDNDNEIIYGINEKGIMSWNIKNGEHSLVLESEERFFAVSLSKDSTFLVAATKNKILVYNLVTKRLIKTILSNQGGQVCSWINSLSISYDNKYIAMGGCNNKISLWKVSKSE